MKTNFPLKSKFKNEYRIKILLMAVLFCFLLFSLFIFPNISKSFFYTVSKPIWFVRELTITISKNFIGYFGSKNSLIKQSFNLQDEIASLKLKVMDYETLQKENEELKSLLGRKNYLERIVAKIISKPPRSPYDTLVIDVGSYDGLSKGNRVYISDSIIIGIITNVTPHTSLVTMFSGGGEKQDAVNSRTDTSYELSGKGGGNFSVEVPKDSDVVWGDTFLYPGLSHSVIGSVYYIDSSSQSSFKTIFIREEVNVFQSKFVFVEKSQ